MTVLEVENVDQWNTFVKTQAGGGGKDHVFVVDFYATFCGPCKAVKPKYHELSDAYPQVSFLSIDIEKLEPVADKFNITRVPTFMIVKNHDVVKMIEGADIGSVRAALNLISE